ncbi:MAG: RidA family protein [Acidibrevibacterium sp.]|jgi:enamine deaminase RidA (YjgF/YER057c/UK114 family)|uniref:RidA family protein n=1 Tax=Acidibrevibacterium fodinaquatile TaxID=1969806 RepID=UPI0023A84460|nr:RidA family protein [Acidibrevibacterium fodinaquatile]MCA7120353.1 RidA family protein [Acidibrevibacterium fodinaquatile]
MTTPHQILHPKHWKATSGYTSGLAASGRVVFTSGIVGWNAEQIFASDDFVAQAEQCLKNIVAVLAEAGARPEHLVRLTWYVTSKEDYLNNLKALGRAYKAVIGRHYPAMAVVQVVALIDEGAKLEIEATAVIPA